MNTEDTNHNTPLHRAFEKRDLTSIRLLIQNGADIDAKDIYGKTLKEHMARTSSTSKVEKLLIGLCQ